MLQKGPLKRYYGAKKREKYKFTGSFPDISLSQHLGRVLASSQSRAEWIFGQMLWDVLPLCLPRPLHQSRVHGGARSQKTAPHQLTLVFGTQFTIPAAGSCHCPFAFTFVFSPGEPRALSSPHSLHDSPSPSSPSLPASCLALHYRSHSIKAERASKRSQGPQAPVSSPFCSIFPWESQRNPTTSYLR